MVGPLAMLWARVVMTSAREGQRRGGDSGFDQFEATDLVNENQDFVVFDQESESGGEAAL